VMRQAEGGAVAVTLPGGRGPWTAWNLDERHVSPVGSRIISPST
jgi:hypothetical protein